MLGNSIYLRLQPYTILYMDAYIDVVKLQRIATKWLIGNFREVITPGGREGEVIDGRQVAYKIPVMLHFFS